MLSIETSTPQYRIDRTCVFCGGTYRCSRALSMFCSILCSCRYRAQRKAQRNLIKRIKECAFCGETFTAARTSIRYCSVRCSKEPTYNTCACGKQIRSTRKFCSMTCRDAGKTESHECLTCGTLFLVNTSVVKRGRLAGMFCSQTCTSTYRSGANNPNWSGGENHTYRGKDWRSIRATIRARDAYKCRDCGKPETGRNHDVHHIIPWRVSNDNHPDNLITLCRGCHRLRRGPENHLLKRLYMDDTSLWIYRAETVRVVDGDTAIFRFDLGFNVTTIQTCRFDGINAPEHNTVEGQAALDFLKGLLPVGTPVYIKTRKDKKEKYGRLLATVVLKSSQIVNDALVAAGHALPWDGKGVKPV